METVSEMYRNRPSAASASAKPSSDCRMCVPWCCSNNSNARPAVDRLELSVVDEIIMMIVIIKSALNPFPSE
jgi:hypothetical protein